MCWTKNKRQTGSRKPKMSCSDRENPNKSLTYVELQAKFSPYAEQEQNEGYMKMVLNFGFIAMSRP